MGNILVILINIVFLFIIMGVVFEGIGGGFLMIKLFFYVMCCFCGGFVYVVIMVLFLFGMIFGFVVFNVVGMGVIIILMIKKCGFFFVFVGGVEVMVLIGG